MPNIAIVIGIDQYQTALTSLTGAVEDAIDFASWLVDSHEVLPENLHLGLGPDVGSPAVPPGLATCAAFVPSLDELDRILIDLLDRPPPDLDRLYFFFSGHGAAVSASYYSADAICLKGFGDRAFKKALEVASLKEVLLGIPAARRFVFLDGCRDAVFREDIHFGRSDRSPRAAPGARETYVLHATSAGRQAVECGMRGLFSRHLCRGLRGEGAAKRWDGDADGGNGLYRVRWGALSRFVADEVARWAQGRPVPVPDAMQLVTIGGGETIANHDPVFAELTAAQVADVTVRIVLKQPQPAPPGAVIVMRRAETAEVDRPHDLATQGHPAVFTVPPSAWVIWARAPGHNSRPRQKTLAIYDDGPDDEIELDIVLPPVVVPAPRGPVAGFGATPAPWGAIHPPGAGIAPPRESDATRTGDLVILVASRPPGSIRPLHRISILKESGVIVADNPGDAPITLPSDIYRVRISNAEGRTAEALAYVAPGTTTIVDLPLPDAGGAPVAQAMAAADKPPPSDGFTLPSERVGLLAGASLTTVAALATGQSVLGHPGDLARLGLARTWLGNDRTGVQVVIALDRPADDQPIPTPLARLWRMFDRNDGRRERLDVTNAAVALATADIPADPAGYWLELQDPDRSQRRGFKLATVVLADHVTLVVRSQMEAGRVEILQFALSRTTSPYEQGLRAIVDAEALQRALLAGRDPLVDPVALALIAGEWFEPFSAMLLAAVLLDASDGGGELLGRMLAHCEAASIDTVDTRIMRGVVADRAGDLADAKAHFSAALASHQAPVIDRLLDHLDVGARDYRLTGPAHRWIREKMAQAMGHPLWTLRREDDRKAGKPDAVTTSANRPQRTAG